MAREKKRKKQYKRSLEQNATKILCQYCDLKDTCKRKDRKEDSEQKDIMTSCLLTPNKKSKIPKWIKLDKNGRVINVNKNGIPIDKSIDGEKTSDKTENKRYNKSYRKIKKDN